MRLINQFIIDTLFFIVLIMALVILIIGSYFVIKTMLIEMFGYKLDLFKRGKEMIDYAKEFKKRDL